MTGEYLTLAASNPDEEVGFPERYVVCLPSNPCLSNSLSFFLQVQPQNRKLFTASTCNNSVSPWWILASSLSILVYEERHQFLVPILREPGSTYFFLIKSQYCSELRQHSEMHCKDRPWGDFPCFSRLNDQTNKRTSVPENRQFELRTRHWQTSAAADCFQGPPCNTVAIRFARWSEGANSFPIG